jgi:hypothetical protein
MFSVASVAFVQCAKPRFILAVLPVRRRRTADAKDSRRGGRRVGGWGSANGGQRTTGRGKAGHRTADRSKNDKTTQPSRSRCLRSRSWSHFARGTTIRIKTAQFYFVRHTLCGDVPPRWPRINHTSSTTRPSRSCQTCHDHHSSPQLWLQYVAAHRTPPPTHAWWHSEEKTERSISCPEVTAIQFESHDFK